MARELFIRRPITTAHVLHILFPRQKCYLRNEKNSSFYNKQEPAAAISPKTTVDLLAIMQVTILLNKVACSIRTTNN